MNPFVPMLGKYAPKEPRTSTEGTILSVRHLFHETMKREDAEEKLRSVFRSLSPKAMVDHVILGHFKGAIRCGEAVFMVSMTREDVLDETANEIWKSLITLPEGEVTVNLLSVVPVPVDEPEVGKTIELHF